MDYQKGKIYKITSQHTTNIYIGSTALTLQERLQRHKTAYKRYTAGKIKRIGSIMPLFELGEVEIELIEAYPCNTRKELTKREGTIQLQYNNCINSNIAGRTLAEYYQDNANDIRARVKNYYLCNRDKIKNYYIANREARINYSKKYYKSNKPITIEQEPIQLEI